MENLGIWVLAIASLPLTFLSCPSFSSVPSHNSMATAAGLRLNFGRADQPPESPLFERQMHTDTEFAEQQQLRHFIETLQARVVKLERINTDLENRLEDQAKQSMTVEAECISIDRKWKARCEALEQEIEKLKAEFVVEKQKGETLRGQLSRAERELYGILQRKYELMRGPMKPGTSIGKPQPFANEQLDMRRDSSWDGGAEDAASSKVSAPMACPAVLP